MLGTLRRRGNKITENNPSPLAFDNLSEARGEKHAFSTPYSMTGNASERSKDTVLLTQQLQENHASVIGVKWKRRKREIREPSPAMRDSESVYKE